MRGDITRSTFRPEKRYSGVRQQQGRVQLDSDWNEELDILGHLDRSTRIDTIGPAAAPKGPDGGFGIGVAPAGADLTVSPGRTYVGGLLAELPATALAVTAPITANQVTLAGVDPDGAELAPPQWLELSAPGVGPILVQIGAVDVAKRLVTFAPALTAAQVTAFNGAGGGQARRIVTYLTQPDLPGPGFATATSPPRLALPDGSYLAYLDVWERLRTALEDSELREVALGGPDTATRVQTVWQVRLLRVADAEADEGCDGAFPELDARTAPRSGRLTARAQPQQDAGDCLMPAAAGFRRLENQLYRVEVHTPGPLGTATFKWSRENGSVVSAWVGQPAANQIQVSSPGPDAALGFAPGQFVELIDDGRELRGQPGVLVELVQVEGDVLTFQGGSASLADFPVNPKVRRWESAGDPVVEVPSTNNGWIALEDGIEVRFAAGDYATGDYWLIPARTATADVDWPRNSLGTPLFQPAAGIHHQVARLALLRSAGGGVTLLADCRHRFPELSTICADDVCYQGACTDAGPTVQHAIDFLCQEKDLRFHNRHLHGTGIVCGLQVHCDFDEGGGGAVEVLPGYAIDCDGNDRDLTVTRVVQLLSLVKTYDAGLPQGQTPILDGNGDGEAALYLVADATDRVDGIGFAVEPMDPTHDSLQSRLDGTIIKDFYEQCVKPLVDFYRKETTPTDPNAPDSPQDHLRTALVDLAAQIANPAGGERIFVSRAEHGLLHRFYTDLRALLQSETFCAMFAKARPYPDYTAVAAASQGMDTVFARGEHVRLRLRPGRHEAFSVGPGIDPLQASTTLNWYDLDKNRLIAQIDPLAGTSLPKGTTTSGAGAIQDVALSTDGNTIHVIVPTRDGKDTFVRSGTIVGTGITWRSVSVICGVKLMTLEVASADPQFLYATGLGQGIYRIDPNNVAANQAPLAAFKAVGHLAIQGPTAVATASSGGTDQYDQLVRVQIPGGGAAPPIALAMPGSDGFAIYAVPDGAAADLIYVVVGPDTTNNLRHIHAYNLQTGAALDVDLQVTNTTLALAVFPSPSANIPATLLVSLADDYSLRVVDLATNQWAVDNVEPLQVAPMSIAVDRTRQFAYVLNYGSSSVSTIDGSRGRLSAAHDSTADLLPALATYRKQALEAYADLLAGTAQYLKDCLCEHLLVRCPECSPRTQKLYLAGVKIVNSTVYRICNFSLRHYVKSFPTMGYWLSLIPIVPLVGWLFERLCCEILTDRSAAYTAPGYKAPSAPAQTTDRAWASVLIKALGNAQGQDLPSRLAALLSRGSIVPQMVMGALEHPAGLRLPLTTTPATAGGWSIVNQPADTIAANLGNSHVLVRRAPYDPGHSSAIQGLFNAFQDPPAGSEVTLYEQNGVVRYYTIDTAVSPGAVQDQLTNLNTQLQAKQAQVDLLNTQLQTLLQRQEAMHQTQLEQTNLINRLNTIISGGQHPPATG